MNFSRPYRSKASPDLSHLLGKLTLGLSLLFASCNGIFMDEQKENTVQNNFDLLWQIIDEHYCFFEEKNTDWDQVYMEFNHEKRHCGNDPSSQCLFYTMGQMLERLSDGHVNLRNGLNTVSYSGWHSSYSANFNISLIMPYLKQRRAKTLNNGICLVPLTSSIGYIYCPSFSEKLNRNDFDNALAMFSGYKGVIIDVRDNTGGLVSEAYTLASRFAREKTHVGYMRYKTGKGHNDFSEYFARYVEPEGTNPFHGQVAVITNRKVYSAANLFVSIMKSLPQVCVMGDYTGGGGGVPITAELYNGWTVEFSTNPIFDTNKESIEPGIEPHQIIMLDSKNDQDNIIEAAKNWILEK